MNILIMSPGRRVEIVEYFKKEVHKENGKVYCADMSKYAPALYAADEYFILEKNFQDLDKYIDDIINLCIIKKIKFILTLIDPELKLFSDYQYKFSKVGIKVLLSSKDIIDNTFDKLHFFDKFKNQINLVKTYGAYDEVISAIERNEIRYPVFVKDRFGSGSSGLSKVDNINELKIFKDDKTKVFQPFLECKEYGVDVYFDMINKRIVSLFMKEKINMRSGETDKSVSVFREDILNEVIKLQEITGFYGNIDVDVFVTYDNKVYINEINPRFGGGYPHAYNCGVNFIKMIVNNLKGKENLNTIGEYKKGIIMMKYNSTIFIDENKEC